MATCVKCKKEIDSTLRFCPHCGAKQNIFIDANQAVSKNLIGNEKFDAKKDITKAPRVEIIIDDSEAATPLLENNTEEEVKKYEDLPSPPIKEADISDYTTDIEIALFNDVNERMNNASFEEEEIEEEDTNNITYENIPTIEEEKSRKVNIFNIIFNILFGGGILFLVGFPYFYQTSNMLFIRTLKNIKHNLPNLLRLGQSDYTPIFGLCCLVLSLIFYLIFIIQLILTKKPLYKKRKIYLMFGLNISFSVGVLYFNSLMGNFKFDLNYFFHIYSYIIILLIIITLVVNMICRISDPLNLTFRWGYIRYGLENKELLPKLNGMDKALFKRNIVYIIIAMLLLFNNYLIYLEQVVNLDLHGYQTPYAYLFSNYVNYKASWNGFINIFHMLKHVTDALYNYGYSYFLIANFILMILVFICIIANEYITIKKSARMKRIYSFLYVITYIALLVFGIRSFCGLFAIIDGAGVNEGIDPLLRNTYIAQSVLFIVCFAFMIIERFTNKNIVRKETSVYRSNN